MDDAVLLWINQHWTYPICDYFFAWLSQRGTFAFPLLGLFIYDSVRKAGWSGARFCLLLLGTVAFGNTLGDILKALFAEPRPCLLLYEHLRAVGDSEPCKALTGMPSSHALNFFTVATLVLLATPWRWWSGGLITVAVLVGLSRIYLGRHYPSQVLVGGFFGIIIGVLSAQIAHYYQLAIRRPQPHAPPLAELGAQPPYRASP